MRAQSVRSPSAASAMLILVICSLIASASSRTNNPANLAAHRIHDGDDEIIVADHTQRKAARFAFDDPLGNGIDYRASPHQYSPHEVDSVLGKVGVAFDLVPFEFHARA